MDRHQLRPLQPPAAGAQTGLKSLVLLRRTPIFGPGFQPTPIWKRYQVRSSFTMGLLTRVCRSSSRKFYIGSSWRRVRWLNSTLMRATIIISPISSAWQCNEQSISLIGISNISVRIRVYNSWEDHHLRMYRDIWDSPARGVEWEVLKSMPIRFCYLSFSS